MRIFALCLLFAVVRSAPHWKPRYQLPDPNIIGGTPAIAGEFPYTLSLQDTSFGFRFHFCGAFIYNENWGVSAAMCFQGEELEDPSYIIAVAGELEIDVLEGHEQDHPLSQVIQHEDFDGFTRKNDLALLKVNTPFIFNDYVKPLNLPEPGLTATGDCFISGWGTTEEGGTASKILLKAMLPVITDHDCHIAYGSSLDKDTMMCAGYFEGGVAACTADTGGPLTCFEQGSSVPYAAGVVSWSRGCGKENSPGVFTEVSHYVEWIESHAV